MSVQSWPDISVPLTTHPLPALSLFDTASGKVKKLPTHGDISMYVCGITPYDATHLGHAATYLTFDLVSRYVTASGQRVHYVQNVTDVDDPLFERAARDGVDWRELAHSQIELFRSDMTHLRIIPPDHYIGAVETMQEVGLAVDRLLSSGVAYRIADDDDGDIYFDISATGRFGYESGYDESLMLRLAAERGGDPQRAGKRHPLDPLLWRMARPGEPSWDSPMGAGRAGWHIECAVIATHYLGETVTIQGGGSDLIFPHHECSAAHAEALTGQFPFAEHYVHTGMMELDGEKMSKSLGNLEFVSRLTAVGHDPMVIRLALLEGQYRSDRPWQADALDRAQQRLGTWRQAAARTGQSATSVIDEMAAALATDLDTDRAIDVIDRWAATPDLAGPDVALAVDALLGIPLGS